MQPTPELVFNCFSHAVRVSRFDRFNFCEGDTVGCLCADWVIGNGTSTVATLNLAPVYLQRSVDTRNAFLSGQSEIEHENGSGGRTSLNRQRSIVRIPSTTNSSELEGLKMHTPFSNCAQIR